jgi:hypothetical protein
LISFGLISITALGAAGASDGAGTDSNSIAFKLRADIENCAGIVKPLDGGPDATTKQLNQISLANNCYQNLARRTGMVAVLTPITIKDAGGDRATVGICFFMKGEVILPAQANPQFVTDRSVDPSFVTCWDDSLPEFRPAFHAAKEVFKAHGLSREFEVLLRTSKIDREKILSGGEIEIMVAPSPSALASR